MKTRKFLLLAILVIGSLAGCASGPSTAGTKTFDYDAAGLFGKAALRTTTKLTLDNNPALAPEVEAINAGLATIFSGELTPAVIAAELHTLAPNLPAGDIALYAADLADLAGYFATKTGKPVLVPTSPEVQRLIASLSQGITEGVALHNAGR